MNIILYFFYVLISTVRTNTFFLITFKTAVFLEEYILSGDLLIFFKKTVFWLKLQISWN